MRPRIFSPRSNPHFFFPIVRNFQFSPLSFCTNRPILLFVPLYSSHSANPGPFSLLPLAFLSPPFPEADPVSGSHFLRLRAFAFPFTIPPRLFLFDLKQSPRLFFVGSPPCTSCQRILLHRERLLKSFFGAKPLSPRAAPDCC